MYDVVCSGGLSSDGQYKKKVHIAYDSLVWKDECDVTYDEEKFPQDEV